MPYPWSARDAHRHNRKIPSGKYARMWAHIANGVYERTGDVGRAITEANGRVNDYLRYGRPVPGGAALGKEEDMFTLDLDSFEGVEKWGDGWKRQLRDWMGRWSDTPGGGSQKRPPSRSAPRRTSASKPSSRTSSAVTSRRRAVSAPAARPSARSTSSVSARGARPPAVGAASSAASRGSGSAQPVRVGSVETYGLNSAQRASVDRALRRLGKVYGDVDVDYIGKPQREKGHRTSTKAHARAFVDSGQILLYSKMFRADFAQQRAEAVRTGWKADTAADHFEAVVAHELGHMLHARLGGIGGGMFGGSSAKEKKFRGGIQKALGLSYGVSESLGGLTPEAKARAVSVSGYAETDLYELVAESLALHAYRPGKNRTADAIARAYVQARKG